MKGGHVDTPFLSSHSKGDLRANEVNLNPQRTKSNSTPNLSYWISPGLIAFPHKISLFSDYSLLPSNGAQKKKKTKNCFSKIDGRFTTQYVLSKWTWCIWTFKKHS